ncbi:glycosyltransferase family 2 protein [Thorsellia anophelis]|uniref:(Heptosyl)LPS beta-1,4-glucosyltransferase n=1 Tax=Thorsellia anophelis DSM 18579 TaxID=1123402 RepID=A0A1I0E297_9GAMM|nr:glycosyltransferase family 2 protein [Thorsellia anophelis]SET38739.1 (heptosyl)LPS beta-1,4-glucosyltransferase [Thorsellia anophelis DSM 18579]
MELKRLTLSILIITKNEAELISDCLLSCQFADEIILLDSGSIDSTPEIAKELGAKVYIDKEWEGFGKQRQKIQNYATCDLVLMIDADERISSELQSEIKCILNGGLPVNEVYAIPRLNFFLGRYMKYSGWFPDYVIRLYSREHFRYKDDLVHESLNFGDAKVKKLKGYFTHLTCRDLFQFQKKQLHYAQIWASERAIAHKRCNYSSIWIHTIAAFFKTYFIKCGFLDGKQGLLLSFVNANYTFNKYTILWINKSENSR